MLGLKSAGESLKREDAGGARVRRRRPAHCAFGSHSLIKCLAILAARDDSAGGGAWKMPARERCNVADMDI